MQCLTKCLELRETHNSSFQMTHVETRKQVGWWNPLQKCYRSIFSIRLRWNSKVSSVYGTILYSLLFFLSLPYWSDVAILCWQSLTPSVTFPLITTFQSPTLSVLLFLHSWYFPSALSLIHLIYLYTRSFIIHISLLIPPLFLFLVMCCSCVGQLAQDVQFSSTTDPVINIKPPCVSAWVPVWVCVREKERACVSVSLIQQTSGNDISNGFRVCCCYVGADYGAGQLLGNVKSYTMEHKTCSYASDVIWHVFFLR